MVLRADGGPEVPLSPVILQGSESSASIPLLRFGCREHGDTGKPNPTEPQFLHHEMEVLAMCHLEGKLGKGKIIGKWRPRNPAVAGLVLQQPHVRPSEQLRSCFHAPSSNMCSVLAVTVAPGGESISQEWRRTLIRLLSVFLLRKGISP